MRVRCAMFTSLRNELFLKMRSRLRFSRRGYCEIGTEAEEDTILEQKLVQEFSFHGYRHVLSPLQWKRNLATLWLLNSFTKWSQVPWKPGASFLEVGCQDFSRLPALKQFFNRWNGKVSIHGLELDPLAMGSSTVLHFAG